MKQNLPAVNLERTHEGGMAMPKQPAELELRRCLVNCLLFENTFYESGEGIAERIVELIAKVQNGNYAVPFDSLYELAVYARQKLGLRHAPLWLARCAARRARQGGDKSVADLIDGVIRRADELSEFLALYWRGKRQPLAAQVKKGLARAFTRFDAYQLAKYDRAAKVRLRDVLFLTHPKPKDAEQAATWKQLVENKLSPPDTWEVALSGGADKKAAWERLLSEGRLGPMALIRNLRNMEQAQVDSSLIRAALLFAKPRGILPFQYVAAWRAAPAWSQELDKLMQRSFSTDKVLQGETLLVLDVSGSMTWALSGRSKLNRIDATSALAVLLAASCEHMRCFTFSQQCVEIPSAASLMMIDGIHGSQEHLGTYLAGALSAIKERVPNPGRIIVVTDEQSHDGIIPAWCEQSYLVNVAPYALGLDTFQGWTRISGFSERIVDWIAETEIGKEAEECIACSTSSGGSVD